MKALEPGMMVHAHNLSTQDPEAGGWRVQGQLGPGRKTLENKHKAL